MGKKDRQDSRNSLHGITGRGVGRRTVFETREDVRYFLSRLARVARAGMIEVVSYCILTNHFHLLVRSPRGELSLAMQLVLNEYVRWFNRKRKRDGPLFRGRFWSKRVDSEAHFYELVRYIDQNAIKARLPTTRGGYPYGSAYFYRQESGPPWLHRELIETWVCRISRKASYDPTAYDAVFGEPLGPAQKEIIEQRMKHRKVGEDPLRDLVGAAPRKVRARMIHRALRADGTPPGLPIVSAETVRLVIGELAGRDLGFQVWGPKRKVDGWSLLHAGILRSECGLAVKEIAMRLGKSVGKVSGDLGLHRERLVEDEDYAEYAGRVVAMALERDHPGVARILRWGAAGGDSERFAPPGTVR